MVRVCVRHRAGITNLRCTIPDFSSLKDGNDERNYFTVLYDRPDAPFSRHADELKGRRKQLQPLLRLCGSIRCLGGAAGLTLVLHSPYALNREVARVECGRSRSFLCDATFTEMRLPAEPPLWSKITGRAGRTTPLRGRMLWIMVTHAHADVGVSV